MYPQHNNKKIQNKKKKKDKYHTFCLICVMYTLRKHKCSRETVDVGVRGGKNERVEGGEYD
jgi:hypothetical protein